MRTNFLKKLLTTYLLIFSGIILMAQDSSESAPDVDTGNSNVECALELSNMAEFMKINLPEYAYSAWKKLFNHCPDASKNIYISGAKIYSERLRRERDMERRQQLFDTLMMIYDRRIEYYGEEGYVEGRRGMDIIRYNEPAYELAYASFKKSTDILEEEASLNVITGFMQTGSVMLKSEKISPSEFLTDYLSCAYIMKNKEQAGESPSKLARVNRMLDEIVANTRIEDCNAIETTLSDRVTDPEVSGDFLRLCVDLLTISGCDNTEFFSDVNEKLMEVDPDPKLAYEVAKYNLKNNNSEKAAEYLSKAIEAEEASEQMALYEYQLAVVNLSKLNNPIEAKKLATSAANHKEGWGEPYFVVASAILEGVRNCNMDAFDKQAAYWLAVDYCVKAKSIEPDLAGQANELIAQYTANFPSKEETFFRSLNAGDSYVIGCWINETTTVKHKE